MSALPVAVVPPARRRHREDPSRRRPSRAVGPGAAGRHRAPEPLRPVDLQDVLVLRPDGGRAVGVSGWVVSVTAAVLLVGLVVLLGQGGRWFVVETPSMGRAAPVGSVVVTLPVGEAPVRTREVVTFRPDGESRAWTHRVVRVAPDGAITTRGDVNGADDPWTLHRTDLVGRVVATVPVLGWVVRGTPLLVALLVVAWGLTGVLRDPVVRGVSRVLGATTALTGVIAVLQPLVAVRLVTTTATGSGVAAVLVAVGALPVRVVGADGASVRLSPGATGSVPLPAEVARGRFTIASSIDLDPVGWALLVAVSLVPLVLCLAIGRRRTGP